MSYGFHRLPKKATIEDYIIAEAKHHNLPLIFVNEIQGNEVTMSSSNTPGDDQSIPQMSQDMPVGHNDVNNQMTVDVRSQGYTGDICTSCQGLRMRWAGHCQICEDCGSSSGCS